MADDTDDQWLTLARILARYEDPVQSYRSAARMATETPQPLNPYAQNAGPLTPMNKLLFDVGLTSKDPINDEGRRLALGLMGGVRSPMTAAVRYKGNIFTGRNHGEAYEAAIAAHPEAGDAIANIPFGERDGFIVGGRYMTRAEATQFAMANDPSYRPMAGMADSTEFGNGPAPQRMTGSEIGGALANLLAKWRGGQ